MPNLTDNNWPSRVLFVLDQNDERQEDQSHTFYTNWKESTDFQWFLSSTSFGHASGVYYAEAIYKEITWLNSILGRNLPFPADEATSYHELAAIKQTLNTTLILLGIEIFLLILILRNIIWLVGDQKRLYMKFKRNLKEKKKKSQSTEHAKLLDDELAVKTLVPHVSQDRGTSISSPRTLVSSAISISGSNSTSSTIPFTPTSSHISKYSSPSTNQIKSITPVGDGIWQHARFWMKYDSKIANPGVKSDNQLHQEYHELITNLKPKAFSSRMFIALGIIISFQLFITFYWSEQVSYSTTGTMIFLYLTDVLGQNTAIFVDNIFKLPYMWYWVAIFIFIGYFLIRTKELHELGDYSSNHTLRGWGVALEIFIAFYFLLHLASRNYVGNLLYVLALRNVLAFLFFLKFFT
ncbi:MAG: hypothetical protein KAR20_21940, partial [Candidatus Heimdallarchaeota archaeon]|nr:hypothetical protein [Candidatus Heimdallarchaeota archaeon]